METESVIVNGHNKEDINNEEKILKPRKPNEMNGEEVKENGVNGVENGFDESKETTPVKQANTKRELRKRELTPKPLRETTPKPQKETKRRGTPMRSVSSKEKESEDISTDIAENEAELKETNEAKTIDEEKTQSSKNIEKGGLSQQTDNNLNDSVILVEDNSERFTVSINDSQETSVEKKDQKSSFFSVFCKNSNTPIEIKDACEASSSSVICLGTPSDDEKYVPSGDIKGRKSINSFSRFPGRNVSITSTSSLKRKVEDLEDDEPMKFSGATESSGSEKSPGWHFFSQSFRGWSPVTKTPKMSLPSSTPFQKRVKSESMAVNYDEDTKLSLGDTMEAQTEIREKSFSKPQTQKWCTVM